MVIEYCRRSMLPLVESMYDDVVDATECDRSRLWPLQETGIHRMYFRV